jgi:hypothetical protein
MERRLARTAAFLAVPAIVALGIGFVVGTGGAQEPDLLRELLGLRPAGVVAVEQDPSGDHHGQN